MARRPRTIRTQFRGLNTEQPINRLASGTARVARNVVREGSYLRGRPGFDEFEGEGTVPIFNITTAAFAKATAENEIYVVVKRSNGEAATFQYAKMWDNTNGQQSSASWTSAVLTYTHTHSVADPGWWMFHADRLYYGDSGGVSKWAPITTNKPNTKAADFWKAGIQSLRGATLTAAATGGKEGCHFVGVVLKNSVTHDLSCIQDLQGTLQETRYTSDKGAFTVDNWNSGDEIRDYALNAKFEWDKAVFVCTLGTTEGRYGQVAPSLQFFVETEYARTETENPSLSLADQALQHRERHRNSGGVPPGSRLACFNGKHALYANVYSSGALVGGQVAVSLARHPAMVPGDQTYTIGGKSTTWPAEPWNGFLSNAIDGEATGVGFVGRDFVIYTATGAYWLRVEDGRGPYAIRANATGGCLSKHGCVTTGLGVYGMGKDCLMRAGREGVRNLAWRRFTPTIQAIPTSDLLGGNPQRLTIAGHYGFRSEVWFAVARQVFDCDIVAVYDATNEETHQIDTASSGTGYTYNYQLFPDTPAAGDMTYWGWTAKPSSGTLTVAVNRPAIYDDTDVIEWSYSDGEGTWAALTVTRDTTNPDDQDGDVPFVDDGTITFTKPDDWAAESVTVTIAGEATATSKLWIRAKIATGKAANMTQVPFLTTEGPSRVLVYDEAADELVSMLDPRNLRGAEITCMTEYATPGQSPLMLLGLSDGRIVSWPSANYYDTDGDGTYNYSTMWTGYVGQERRHVASYLADYDPHYTDDSEEVDLAIAGVRTGDETVVATSKTSDPDTDANVPLDHGGGVDFDPNQHGPLYKITISTSASATATSKASPHWEIVDVLLDIDNSE